VLAAVLADAWHVALDVTRLKYPPVEGRVEELDELAVGAHQTPFDRGQGLSRALRVGGTGDHRPGLREGVDLALVVLGRAERGAVVEVGAAVPAAVPGVLLQRGPQRLGPLPAPGRTRRVANPVGQVRERLQHG